jgi:hypothetical protein
MNGERNRTVTKSDLLRVIADLPENAEIRLTGEWGENAVEAATLDGTHTLWLHSCGIANFLREAGMLPDDPDILYLAPGLIPTEPADLASIALKLAKTQY